MKHTIKSNIWVCYYGWFILISTDKNRYRTLACFNQTFLQNQKRKEKKKKDGMNPTIQKRKTRRKSAMVNWGTGIFLPFLQTVSSQCL